MTTTQRRYALLLALALTVFVLCACLDDGERSEWLNQVNSRQRGLQRPTVTPPAERTE